MLVSISISVSVSISISISVSVSVFGVSIRVNPGVTLFTPGINTHLGWSDHKWTALVRQFTREHASPHDRISLPRSNKHVHHIRLKTTLL